MPSGNVRIIPDFLPPPDQLIFPKDAKKITITIDGFSVDFFKKKAKLTGAKYQQMIREVLRRYALHHSQKKAA